MLRNIVLPPLVFFSLFAYGFSVHASERNPSDSISGVFIKEVTVEGQKNSDAAFPTPYAQHLNRQQLETLTGEQVSDAVRFFSGALVKDYGGLGGVKTLSVRNFGAQHTAVTYDGLVLSDCQTGQIDIGKFVLGNVEQLDYQIANGGDLFQTAKAFASTGLLSIQSGKLTFKPNKPYKGRVGVSYGSFDTKSAQMAMAWKMGTDAVWNLQTHWLKSAGNFPYKEWVSDTRYQLADRANNANESFVVESNWSGTIKQAVTWEVKAFYNQSDKQLPGAVLLYNSSSHQQLWDKNGFVQGRVEGVHRWKGRWKVLGKYNRSTQRYLNPDYLGSTGKEDYTYNQYEAYTSFVFDSRLTQPLQMSFSLDAAHNAMNSNMNRFPNPGRWSVLEQLSMKYQKELLETAFGVLGTNVWEQTELGEKGRDVHRFSPWFHVKYQPFERFDGLFVKLFYKSSFRMPTFNDLYYTAIGNTRLKPETAHQWNLGISLNGERQNGWQPYVSLDAFYNRVLHKIQAVPTRNLFVWSMTNVGEADIRGLDATLGVVRTFTNTSNLRFTWNHSYQRALDVSKPGSATYQQQLAYAPRIYGSLRAAFSYKPFECGYNVVYSGHRYVSGQNLAENNIPGYHDHQLSLKYSFQKTKIQGHVKCEIQNLWNESYDLVRNFPMPGRSFRTVLQLDI